jgi:hypothetical protein
MMPDGNNVYGLVVAPAMLIEAGANDRAVGYEESMIRPPDADGLVTRFFEPVPPNRRLNLLGQPSADPHRNRWFQRKRQANPLEEEKPSLLTSQNIRPRNEQRWMAESKKKKN